MAPKPQFDTGMTAGNINYPNVETRKVRVTGNTEGGNENPVEENLKISWPISSWH
jgi:hypothetical protein